MLRWHEPTPGGITGAEFIVGNCRLSFSINPVGDFAQEDLFGGTVWELRFLEGRWFPSITAEGRFAPRGDGEAIHTREFFYSIHDSVSDAKATAERLALECEPDFDPVPVRGGPCNTAPLSHGWDSHPQMARF